MPGVVPGLVGVGAVGMVGASSVGEGTGESPSMKHGASPQTEQASPWSRILEWQVTRQAVKKVHQISGARIVQARLVVCTMHGTSRDATRLHGTKKNKWRCSWL